MNDHVELKSLQTQIKKAEAELKSANEEKQQAQGNVERVRKRLNKLKSQKEQLTQQHKVVITEHAILRYLEHVYGLDIDKIKLEMMPQATKEKIQQMGSGKYPVEKSHKLVVERGIVKTTIPLNETKKLQAS